MKAFSSQVTDNPISRIRSRILLVTAAAATALLAAGCTAPTNGPTDPKEFISQGREWTSSNPNAGAPALPTSPPTAPTTPPTAPSTDTGAVPPPNG
ncbi:MAG: hypothetical protein ABI273_11535 [Lacunisphaera sp.]